MSSGPSEQKNNPKGEKIMGYNTQTTASSGLSVGMQTAYDKIMLKYSVPNLVHAQGAVQKNIPANSGKVAQWRRFTPLAVITTPLSEGVIPDGQNVVEEQVLATVYQHGGYITKTDLFDLTHMDSRLAGLVKLMANQGSRSQDAIIRDVMATTTTTQYANSRTSIYTLRTTDKLDIDEIRKMVRTLKKNLAPTFKSGGQSYYLAIVGPDTAYDIMDDAKWLDPAKYKDTMKIYNGELGKMYGVRFLETTEGKKYENSELVDGSLSLTVASVLDTTITVDEAITAAEATALVDRYINILDITDTTLQTGQRKKITAAAAGAAGAATITVDSAPTTGFTAADGDLIYANEYGWNGNTVYSTFVFGDEAYAVADINGSGKMRTIVKTAKEIGGPLEQFSTVGWKITAFACAILQALWIGQIYSGASE
jgi:N4-gp56 family major capsid protein